VQIMQGIAVLGSGLLASQFEVPTVVGVWSLAGVLLVSLAAVRWPSSAQFTAATAAAARDEADRDRDEAVPVRVAAASPPLSGAPSRMSRTGGVGTAA
jgi:hypothetical protein